MRISKDVIKGDAATGEVCQGARGLEVPADSLRRGGHGRGNIRGAGVEVADVAGDVAQRMPNVQSCTAVVRDHVLDKPKSLAGPNLCAKNMFC